MAQRRVRRPRSYTDVLELDLGTVEPSLAGPSRPQDRVPLTARQERFTKRTPAKTADRARHEEPGRHAARAQVTLDGQTFELKDGAVLIAAITSCTNTSNPS